MSMTEHLVEYLQAIRYDQLPEDIILKTKYCILDYIADAVAGKAANLPSVEIAYQYVINKGGAPESIIIGTDKKVPAADAAFINSISGEVLELGDGETSVIGHPGQAVVPAALAIAEKEGGVNGKKFIEAVLAGYEAFIFIGETIMPSSYDRGFSASGCLGNFGSGVAVGRLYDFNDEEMENVIALSACAAGYLRSWNLTGTMDKDLMVAEATRRGALSGILAKMGYTGSKGLLEGEVGFCQAMCGDFKEVTRQSGQYRISDVYFKPYPCCRATHGAIDAARTLYEEGIRADDIEEMIIWSNTRGSLVGIKEPTTFISIRFSQQYAAAVTLLTGQATIHEYTEEFAAREEVKQLLKKTRIEIDPELDKGFPEKDYSRQVEVLLKDGRRKSAYINDIKGSVKNPMTKTEIEAKCRNLLATMYDEDRIEIIIEKVLHIDKLQDVNEIIKLIGS